MASGARASIVSTLTPTKGPHEVRAGRAVWCGGCNGGAGSGDGGLLGHGDIGLGVERGGRGADVGAAAADGLRRLYSAWNVEVDGDGVASWQELARQLRAARC